ncbi:MAG: type II secretion system protein GspG [Fimbriimonadales bacterium]|nr:type II secretion system protein GspG [Fimbriimonadales bacterium]
MQRKKIYWGLGGFIVLGLLCSGAFWAWLRPSPIVIPPRQYPPKNAYDAYKRLAEAMQADLGRDKRFNEIERMLHNDQSRSNVSQADRAYYRKKSQPYLEAYRRFLELPSVAVYEYDYTWLFPEFARFRQLARMEVFMMREALERRQPREAMERAAAQLRFAEQIRNEGAIIHHLVGSAIIFTALTPLREHLNEINDPVVLQKIVDIARRYEQERTPLSEATQSEYYFGLAVYRDLRTGKIKWRDFALWTGRTGTAEEWLYRVGLGVPLLLGASLREYHTLHQRTQQELEKLPWARKLPVAQPKRYLNQTLFYGVENAAVKEATEIALLRTLGCAAAIKLYRQRTGRYPDSLDTLNLGEMSIDPFTGQPLVYRYDAQKGFQLYSVGENRVDDGGRVGATDQWGDLVPLRPLQSQLPRGRGALSQQVWMR